MHMQDAYAPLRGVAGKNYERVCFGFRKGLALEVCVSVRVSAGKNIGF